MSVAIEREQLELPVRGVEARPKPTNRPYDRLNTFQRFDSSNWADIPDVELCIALPEGLEAWCEPKRWSAESAIHFFLDDYRFERVWDDPWRALQKMRAAGVEMVCSPDFSVYRHFAWAAQVWNVYRNRWVAAYWSAFGLTVIPTVGWSDEASLDFAFLGLPKGTVVALSSLGVSDELGRELFRRGFEQLLEVVEPEAIVAYGPLEGMGVDESRVRTFPRWSSRGR